MIRSRRWNTVLVPTILLVLSAGCGNGIEVDDAIDDLPDSGIESDVAQDGVIPEDVVDDVRHDSIHDADVVSDLLDVYPDPGERDPGSDNFVGDLPDTVVRDLPSDPGEDVPDDQIDAGSDIRNDSVDVDDSGLGDEGSGIDSEDLQADDVNGDDGSDTVGDTVADTVADMVADAVDDTAVDTAADIVSDEYINDDGLNDSESDTVDPDFTPTICRPCRVDSECEAEGYLPAAACITMSGLMNLEGSFCLIPCLDDFGCPEGYSCQPSDDFGNKACFWTRGDGQVCECGALHSGADTSCGIRNQHGTCPGVVACTESGLTPCSANTPSAEACDGLDNDCDGVTDQGFVFTEFDGRQLEKGAACGIGACLGGTVVCSPDQTGLTCNSLHNASIEILNDLDDDCDGLIDEGLCHPDCTSRECGGDGCGGSCGTCAFGYSCGSVGICIPDGMVQVPAGSFNMGCDVALDPFCKAPESPRHHVTVSGFFIDRTEVTVSAYAECVSAGACTATGTAGLCQWGHEGREAYPINCVTWAQAQSYCSWVGKRLPTEAEWELAARGTDERLYPWGNDAPSCQFAVMLESTPGCGTGAPAIPCSRSPAGDSPCGACDMSGNLQEWVFDWYASDYYFSSPALNPHGPDSGSSRVTRGGHFSVHDAGWLRGAARGEAVGSIDGIEIGFRCAKTH